MILTVATALLSSVLDNVTTVVLLTPITLSVARTLRVSPFPYLISQIFASNIGGTATLIGDPPNILIGSAAGLDFADFLNLAPVVVVIMTVFPAILWVWFGRSIEDDEDRLDVLATLDPSAAITDRPLMYRTLFVLGLTLAGFLFHSLIGVEAATIALLGATVLMIIGPLDPHESAQHRVEHAVLLRGPVHADRGGRPGRDRGLRRPCPRRRRRWTPRGCDHRHPVGVHLAPRSLTTSPTRRPRSRSSRG